MERGRKTTQKISGAISALAFGATHQLWLRQGKIEEARTQKILVNVGTGSEEEIISRFSFVAVKTILSPNQQTLLAAIGDDAFLCQHFYLSGGTALAEYYLQHRYSEDLDFFSETEVDPEGVSARLKKLQHGIGIEKIEYQQSFHRHLFFLTIGQDVVKTEFTFFPFLGIEPGPIKNGVAIDSLLDIAVNKVFTIYQHPRARDYIDLYCIIQKTGWTVSSLVKKAKVKFDWHVDPVQLGGQFLQAKAVKDYPRMIKRLAPSTWQIFFEDEAKKLDKEIFA